MLHDGDILNDRYRIAQLIGKGGMSHVFMATDLNLTNKLWAVKEVPRTAIDQAGRPIEQSLAMEADLLSKLDHPMIVDIADIVKTDDCLYVVMDYVEGISLDKVIREEGPQKESDVQDWALQICDALDYLHSQNPPIIYRDMKPSNIMIRPDGYIKLIDLGVAREYKDQSCKDTVAFGTEGYAPPEQYGKAQTDARSDIYALGATLWHLLTGESPTEYPLPDIRTKNPDVGEGFANVIVPKCTQLDRDLRYQNCEELIGDLEVYEELTQEYYDQQKSKVTKFIRCVVSGVAMLFLSLILFVVGNVVVTQNYNSQLQIARQAADTNDSIDAYKKAINYKPGEKEPYTELISVYQEKVDGSKDIPILKKDKYEDVRSVIDANSGSLKQSGNFGDVNYEFGKAVFDNYVEDEDSNNDVLNRDYAYSKAKNYFIAARDNSKNDSIIKYSESYINIAEFWENISKMDVDNEEGNEKNQEFLNEYCDSLNSLCDSVNNQSKKVQLNAYAIVMASLKSHAQDFKKNNIPLNTVEKLLDKAARGLKNISFEQSPFSQKYIEALQRRQSMIDSVSANVKRLYQDNNKYSTGVSGK